ncbi:MAG: hypothetical protein ACLFWF_02085 [Alphaproteobacteria bacterium]
MVEREELERAKDFTGPVRIHVLGAEDGWIDGFIVGRGPEFFVMAVLDEANRLDGYSCLRYNRVSRCQVPAPSASRIEKTLRRYGEKPQYPEELSAPDLAQILKFGAHNFGLVTIEDEEPDSALIGKVRFVTNTFVQMVLIGPDGDWDPDVTEFDFIEIRRVDFGGAYERMLLRMAQRG